MGLPAFAPIQFQMRERRHLFKKYRDLLLMPFAGPDWSVLRVRGYTRVQTQAAFLFGGEISGGRMFLGVDVGTGGTGRS